MLGLDRFPGLRDAYRFPKDKMAFELAPDFQHVSPWVVELKPDRFVLDPRIFECP